MTGEDVKKRFEAVASSRVFANIVREFGLDNKKVLDIGCAFGEFLSFFGRGSVGLTCTKEEVEYGRRENLDIRLGNIEDSGLVLDEKFDVIWANNLFEHLYSPHQFLMRIKKFLKKEGFLILGVPVIPSFSFLSKVKPFDGAFAHAHINFFTKNTLVNVVKRAGWRVKDVRTFYFSTRLFDSLLHPVCPHFYVIAVPEKNFRYHEKRMKELSGYEKVKLDFASP
jgi:SAM-dependent methyltransferase